MHALITLYSRAYLTAAFMEIPEDWSEPGEAMSDTVPITAPPRRLLGRVAAWLRAEWQAIREEQRNGPAERLYWPPDL